jgi:hypothetical protein
MSRFKHVSYDKKKCRWHANAPGGKVIGRFDTEREAAIAAATSCVAKYGHLASTSDLLVGDNLLSQEEMNQIVLIVATTKDVTTSTSTLPQGVYRSGAKMYRAKYQAKYLGSFGSIDAAVEFRRDHIATLRANEWEAYLLIEPHRDLDNDVAIRLSGKRGEGLYSKVDASLWHTLTFKLTWSLSTYGYAIGHIGYRQTTVLHQAVFLRLHPMYIPNNDVSIDHINPKAKLDNRGSNLREATRSLQARNKVKLPGTTSTHVGVSATRNGTWRGEFRYHIQGVPKRYSRCHKTEVEAVDALNAKRLEIFGHL